MAGSRRNAAATAAGAVVSATRTSAARIVGERPLTAAPRGSMAANRARTAAPNPGPPAAVASAADPTGGAPSAPWRNVTIKSCGVAARRAPRGRRARRAIRGKRGMNDAMLGGPGSITPAVAGAAVPDTRGGAGNTLVAVITPLIVPSLGIQPLGAVSLLQAASAKASTVPRPAPIDRQGRVTGRSWRRCDGATSGQSAPPSGGPQQRPPYRITNSFPTSRPIPRPPTASRARTW